jgi:hypothetical protein
MNASVALLAVLDRLRLLCHRFVISSSDALLIAFQDRMHRFAWIEEVSVRPPRASGNYFLPFISSFSWIAGTHSEYG